MNPDRWENWLDSLNGYSSDYCYLILIAGDLFETYPYALFEALSDVPGFMQDDSGAGVARDLIIKREFVNWVS